MLDFYVKTGIRVSLRDKRLFEITEVEITRVNCKRVASTESVPIHLNVDVVRPSKKADTVITQLRFTVMFLTQLRFTIMFLDCMLSNDLLHYLSEY